MTIATQQTNHTQEVNRAVLQFASTAPRRGNWPSRLLAGSIATRKSR